MLINLISKNQRLFEKWILRLNNYAIRKGDKLGAYIASLGILMIFRLIYETPENIKKHPIKLIRTNKSSSYKRGVIRLNFGDIINTSKKLNRASFLLNVIAHELGHYYVANNLPEYVNTMWNEIISDFMIGLTFETCKLECNCSGNFDINTVFAEMNYWCEKHNLDFLEMDGYKFYAELLDGHHPFVEARILAVKMGHDFGVSLLYNKHKEVYDMKDVFKSFMKRYYCTLRSEVPISVIRYLIKYNEIHNRIKPPSGDWAINIFPPAPY